MSELPATGLLRLSQIIGRDAVTEKEAEANRRKNEAKFKAKDGKGRHGTLPVVARPAEPGLIPLKKTAWWDGVRSGRFPKPVKLGPRATAWRVEDIRALIESA